MSRQRSGHTPLITTLQYGPGPKVDQSRGAVVVLLSRKKKMAERLQVVPARKAPMSRLRELEAGLADAERELAEEWLHAINQTLALGEHIQGLRSLPGLREMATRAETELKKIALGTRAILER